MLSFQHFLPLRRPRSRNEDRTLLRDSGMLRSLSNRCLRELSRIQSKIDLCPLFYNGYMSWRSRILEAELGAS